MQSEHISRYDSAPQRTRRRSPWFHLAVAIVGVGPLYALSIYTGYVTLNSGSFVVPSAPELLSTLAIMAMFGLMIIGLLAISGESLADLQLRRGAFGSDVLSGIGLFFALLGVVVLSNLLLTVLGMDAIPESNLAIGRALADDPVLLLVFLGPVIWLQAGVLEELTRVFVLTRLWQAFPGGRIAGLIAWSAIFGLAHLYQGVAGVVGVSMIGLVLGAHYLLRGRVIPLIIAHALYDTAAVLMLILMVEHPGLLEQMQ